MDKLIKQIMKFGVVGVIAFFIDFCVFRLLSQFLNIHYLVANVISFTVSLIFNYIASMTFVFKRRDDTSRREEFIKFAFLSIIGLGINELMVYCCVDIFYEKNEFLRELFGINVAESLAKIVATAVVMVYNFISRKLFLEKHDKSSKKAKAE